MLAGEATLGLAGAGAITLAFDQIAPRPCSRRSPPAKDRTEVLFESFVKSNRLALMWGAPFGVGLSLFADLVDHGIGDEWKPAVGLLQAFGVITAVNHVGFNWTAFYRARGDTKPLATVAVLTTLAFLAITLPALILEGLDGLAAGMAAMVAVSLAGRAYYVVRPFPGFQPLRHAVRALAPTVPDAAASGRESGSAAWHDRRRRQRRAAQPLTAGTRHPHGSASSAPGLTPTPSTPPPRLQPWSSRATTTGTPPDRFADVQRRLEAAIAANQAPNRVIRAGHQPTCRSRWPSSKAKPSGATRHTRPRPLTPALCNDVPLVPPPEDPPHGKDPGTGWTSARSFSSPTDSLRPTATSRSGRPFLPRPGIVTYSPPPHRPSIRWT